MKDKQALTTGEVAKYCGVNFRTVIRWIERGHLEAYKLPGRGDNRIPVESFIAFLHSNQMPVPEDLTQKTQSLLLLCEKDASIAELATLIRRADWEPLLTHNPVALGYQLALQQPQAILLFNTNAVEPVNRLLQDLNKTDCLLLLLNASTTVCPEGWHCLRWPSEQTRLLELLKHPS